MRCCIVTNRSGVLANNFHARVGPSAKLHGYGFTGDSSLPVKATSIFNGDIRVHVSISTTKPSESRSRSIEENTRLRSCCETSLSRREVGTLDSFRFLDVAPLLVISTGNPREVAAASLSHECHLIFRL